MDEIQEFISRRRDFRKAFALLGAFFSLLHQLFTITQSMNNDMLELYFFLSGNTKSVATEIKQFTQAKYVKSFQPLRIR